MMDKLNSCRAKRREQIPKTFKRQTEQDLMADWMWEVKGKGGKNNVEVSDFVTGHYILELFISIVNTRGEATL